MEEAVAKKRREIGPGFVLSILLHVLFVAIFLLPLLPAPPQAKPEDSVNVELVPQPEDKKEIATKENEKPDQPPTPTPRPDEKPQQKTAEAQQEPEQPQGKKADEQPPKQSDPQGKEPTDKPSPKSDEAKADKPEEQAEKPASKPDDGGADKPVEKAEQKPSATETPLPDMKGEEKDATTTQQAEASTQPSDTPQTPSNDAAAAQQAEAQAAAEAAAQAQAQAQAQQAQQQADAQSQEANAAKPPASDSTAKASSSAPNVLTTNEPSDLKVQQSQAQSTDQTDPQAQAAAQAPSSDPQQQSSTEQAKEDAKAEPQIAVPSVRPSPTEQASQSQAASGSQGGQTSGTALVTEPQPPKSDAPKRAIQAKKLYSSTEMARLSKSDYDAWKKLPRRQRVAYLCNSEEKLQYRHDLGAVGYVNSALSPAMVSDTSLFGEGVAVQTQNDWQRVAFTCQVDGDALKVVAFSYTVRGRVPTSQLDKLGFAGN